MINESVVLSTKRTGSSPDEDGEHRDFDRQLDQADPGLGCLVGAAALGERLKVAADLLPIERGGGTWFGYGVSPDVRMPVCSSAAAMLIWAPGTAK